MRFFNIFIISKGSFVCSDDNSYGTDIRCEVDSIYYRGSRKYCRLLFDLDGINKSVNVRLKSCKLIV